MQAGTGRTPWRRRHWSFPTTAEAKPNPISALSSGLPCTVRGGPGKRINSQTCPMRVCRGADPFAVGDLGGPRADQGWEVVAVNTRPSLGAMGNAKIHWGRLLGAGSFGRVYQGALGCPVGAQAGVWSWAASSVRAARRPHTDTTFCGLPVHQWQWRARRSCAQRRWLCVSKL